MESERLSRKLAAILYADVAGYSRLTGEDEEGTHRRLSEYLNLVSAAVEEHHGKVVHYAGDAVLADFNTVTDALGCAATIQQDLQERNKDLPEERKVQFRIGINLGEVIVDRDDIYGDGVNVAARLESLAEPGGICISGTVCDAIGNKLAVEYEFMGEQEVKNIAKPVRAYRVLLDTGAPPRVTQPQESALKLPSIAVLPFTNMSGDPEQEYFSDGLTNDIITDLSRFGRLSVIAAHSTFAYKGKSVKVQDIAQELSVHYVLEGSIQRAGKRVRINAQLIDATTGQHVWAERYNRETQDLFEIQDEIIETIVATLAHKVDAVEAERGLRKRRHNVDAYDCYLKGREIFFGRTKETNVASRELMEKAIELDPKYARAYGFLAWIHVHDYRYGWSEDPEHCMGLALELALRALALDPSDYESHWRLGFVYLYKGQLDKAMVEYEKARALNPNHAGFLAEMSGALILVGRPADAIVQIKQAMRINPHYPEWFLANLGWAYYEAGQYQEALATLNKMNNPPNVYRSTLVATYVRLGLRDEACAAAAELLEMEPHFTLKIVQFWPYKDKRRQERFAEDLRKAGVPE
ncbi:MAG: tetratricopeptide repeat protein [Acidiferrobacterales bacterium]